MTSNYFKSISAILLLLLVSFTSYGQSEYDVIVIGGGASGTAAGISSGKLGSKTLIIEETSWLGGMLTSAGVSAIDGNYKLPGGIWGEFKSNLEDYYGGADKLSTGWVSNTLFEPKVGNDILQKMASKVSDLEISFSSKWKNVIYADGIWEVVYFVDGMEKIAKSPILIDATELGDVAAFIGLPYRLGMDAREVIGESFAPEEANDIVQDLTYVVTLQDFGENADKTIDQPADYTPEEFACACAHSDPISEKDPTLDCGKMINYGKLPNGKYMINWPNCGNDYYVNLVELSAEQREKEIDKAKKLSLRFVYYLQHELGYSNLGIAEDEYPTEDNLPMIPYYRESRRFYGLVDFTLTYVLSPYDAQSPLYRTGIAVGDYTIDHHHKKNNLAPAIDFVKIRVPSYTIPLGALIPKAHSGFIVAEKSISVSNIVNGATRLQPVVLGIGQAAGILAALSAKETTTPSEISIRKVQQTLLDQNAYIMPFIDMKPEDPHFQSMQKIGASGILTGAGVPYLWANQTWFYPDQLVSEYELIRGLKPLYTTLNSFWGASGAYLTGERFQIFIEMVKPNTSLLQLAEVWKKVGLNGEFKIDTNLNRRQVSVLLDEILDPFSVGIDWKGDFIF